ncbi:hypothetical protein GCM10009525_68370 [Streptosporangium amethystogenes subsp. fukuiense]
MYDKWSKGLDQVGRVGIEMAGRGTGAARPAFGGERWKVGYHSGARGSKTAGPACNS